MVLLPGVPRELRAIIGGGVIDLVARKLPPGVTPEPVHHRTVHTTGIAETLLAERLQPLLHDLPGRLTDGIDLAYLPDLRGVDLRLSLRGGSESEAGRRFDALLDALDPELSRWRFEADTGDLAQALFAALRRSGRTLATAESCTGGLVAKRMTDLPGSSAVFLGGVVAYANDAKVGLVGVRPEDLERDGAVSEVVARQLAAGAAERLGADLGLGVTGVAGPGGGSDEKPVGTVWIGTSLGGVSEAGLYSFAGGRDAVREAAAQAALARLYRRVEREPDGG